MSNSNSAYCRFAYLIHTLCLCRAFFVFIEINDYYCCARGVDRLLLCRVRMNILINYTFFPYIVCCMETQSCMPKKKMKITADFSTESIASFIARNQMLIQHEIVVVFVNAKFLSLSLISCSAQLENNKLQHRQLWTLLSNSNNSSSWNRWRCQIDVVPSMSGHPVFHSTENKKYKMCSAFVNA